MGPSGISDANGYGLARHNPSSNSARSRMSQQRSERPVGSSPDFPDLP